MFFHRASTLLYVHLQFPPASTAELKLKQSPGTATRQKFSGTKKACDAFGEKKKKKRAGNKKCRSSFILPKRWKNAVIIPSQVDIKPLTQIDTHAIN